jgi:hypothetical protein
LGELRYHWKRAHGPATTTGKTPGDTGGSD